jgi:hypothetical protein
MRFRFLAGLVFWRIWRRWRRRHQNQTTPTQPPPDDARQALADLLTQRAAERVGWQLGDSDTADFKALGLLALIAAAVAILVGIRASLNHVGWIVSLGLLALSTITLLLSVRPRLFDIGPDLTEFNTVMTGASRRDVTEQMFVELLEAIRRNNLTLPKKEGQVVWGLYFFAAAIIAAVAAALAHPRATIRCDEGKASIRITHAEGPESSCAEGFPRFRGARWPRHWQDADQKGLKP